MSKKSLLIYILAAFTLLAGGVFAYFQWWSPSPQEKAADRFLSALAGSSSYESYMHPSLSEHPFLSLFQEKKIEQYSIDRLESIDANHARVWVSAAFPAGTLQLALDMAKFNEQWVVSGLPRTTSYTHGIPASTDRREKNREMWTMDLGGRSLEVWVLLPTELAAGKPVRFDILNDTLIDFEPLQPVPLTRVMSLSDTVLEDRSLGYFEIRGEFPVFQEKEGQLTFTGFYTIQIGTSHATLYRTPDSIGRMAIISGEALLDYSTIRVALQNTEYNSLLHTRIEITCKEDFTVVSLPNEIRLAFQGGDTAEFLPSGSEVVVKRNGQTLASSMFRWYIHAQVDEPLYVRSIRRSHSGSGGTPYRGTLEVAPLNGQLTLINEVSLEEYLYSVVPSEMPVKFGLEALKVQAVAARSYAVRAMQASGYRYYGAHLDDSTASQVYNNISEQDIATHAVQETRGMVAVYSEEIVDTRFFSTSCGYTANFHEVWSSKNNEFPSTEVPYLKALPQYVGNTPDLYHEENFRAFLDQTDMPAYDRFSPFFRWTVVMTRSQMEATLNHNLPALYQQQPLFVLTRNSNGEYQSMSLPEDIGTLLNIEVLKRGAGGNIMELAITTSRGVFKIVKEYNIRLALKPVNYLRGGRPLELRCHDGTTRKDFPLLPSAFAYIDFERDTEGNIRDIIIKGGGYGHGVGMSQYGTYGLTLLGRTWQEIIEHYYPGSHLVKLYQ